jgi:hypothetical protein
VLIEQPNTPIRKPATVHKQNTLVYMPARNKGQKHEKGEFKKNKNNNNYYDYNDDNKVFPVHAMKAYRVNGGVAPFIFNLVSRWR